MSINTDYSYDTITGSAMQWTHFRAPLLRKAADISNLMSFISILPKFNLKIPKLLEIELRDEAATIRHMLSRSTRISFNGRSMRIRNKKK